MSAHFNDRNALFPDTARVRVCVAETTIADTTDSVRLENAAWCYPRPLPGMAAIAGRVAFDHPQLELHVETP